MKIPTDFHFTEHILILLIASQIPVVAATTGPAFGNDENSAGHGIQYGRMNFSCFNGGSLINNILLTSIVSNGSSHEESSISHSVFNINIWTMQTDLKLVLQIEL
ncbi:hypothetical protein LOAG_04122 [Loa loa]|uniref:Uncharacterized protein n=1 Tax=Loa loa TaxID=7209 RepID=A0A1S0U3L3_LOALO|nr:hypothetical protein LOAG_04122 [Loa loa]EFO24365.1 hypothetical protein LOAG_04122 [Loa loa]